eukprot:GHVN01035181.1.p1 GENE.GHVN01035181.1~~GHVN01035181.1.p1  ORF type:complete len:576 (+),score=79.65 GHVN01035181.1:6199-7926(+)
MAVSMSRLPSKATSQCGPSPTAAQRPAAAGISMRNVTVGGTSPGSSYPSSNTAPQERRLVTASASLPAARLERINRQVKMGPIGSSDVVKPTFTFTPAAFEKQAPRQTSAQIAVFGQSTGNPALDAVDRPTTFLAMSPSGTECLMGSADHAAYTFSALNGGPFKRLYTKTSGHVDWVSCGVYAGGEGHTIVTGGVDGNLIVWKGGQKEASGAFHCRQGPVCVMKCASTIQPLVVTGGHDGTVCVWDVSCCGLRGGRIGSSRSSVLANRSARGRSSDLGHGQQSDIPEPTELRARIQVTSGSAKNLPPITSMSDVVSHKAMRAQSGVFREGGECDGHDGDDTDDESGERKGEGPRQEEEGGKIIATGTETGIVSLWDLIAGRCIRPVMGKHRGTVGRVVANGNGASIYLTASVDGRVAVWDIRTPLGSASGDVLGATESVEVFTSSEKKAAPVTELCLVNPQRIVSSGADGRVALLDLRNLQEPMMMKDDRRESVRGTLKGGHSNSPVGSLCLHPSKQMCFSGGMMDDWVVCHDLATLRPIYAMDAMCRTASFLVCGWSQLIVSGDSGNASIFSWE